MKKLLIAFRLHDPYFTWNGQHRNKQSLFVTLREDNVLTYSLFSGWQDNGIGCCITNLGLKESLPLNPAPFKTTEELRNRIAAILTTGVGSHAVASYEVLNEIK